MVIGHRNILEYFESAIAQGSLAHVYCLVGPDQVGKRAVARELAGKLLGQEAERLENSPDFYYVERGVDPKTQKKKKELSVAQARAVRERLQQRAWSGGYQVVVIDDVELLNEEAANALLKTLEEPPERTLVFLLTEDDLALPPTIRSRAQLFYFSLVPERELRRGLESLGYLAREIDAAISFGAGRPGWAIAFLTDSELKGRWNREIGRLKGIMRQPFYAKLAAIEDMFGEKEGDSVKNREGLSKILEIWILFFRQLLLQKNGADAAAVWKIERPDLAIFSTRQLGSTIEGLMTARRLIEQNVHPRLLVEQLVLHF